MYDDRIRGIKNTYNAPDISLVPESKARESYMKLINSRDKPFNKKVNEQEFHEALNVPGMHEKRYKGNAYDKLRRSQMSKSPDSNISVEVLSEERNQILDTKKSNPVLETKV